MHKKRFFSSTTHRQLYFNGTKLIWKVFSRFHNSPWRQACFLYNPQNILYLPRTRQEGCISASQGPIACVVWDTLLCLKGNQQQLPGKAQNPAWQLMLSPGTHKAPITQLNLQHLGWEQDLPLHSLLPVKFVFQNFLVPRSPWAYLLTVRNIWLASLKWNSPSSGWRLNVGRWFLMLAIVVLFVHRCQNRWWMAAYTQAGEETATDTDSHVPDCWWKEEPTPFFM